MNLIWKWKIEWVKKNHPLMLEIKEGYWEDAHINDVSESVVKLAEKLAKKHKARFLSEVVVSRFYVADRNEDEDGGASGQGGSWFIWRHDSKKQLRDALNELPAKII